MFYLLHPKREVSLLWAICRVTYGVAPGELWTMVVASRAQDKTPDTCVNFLSHRRNTRESSSIQILKVSTCTRTCTCTSTCTCTVHVHVHVCIANCNHVYTYFPWGQHMTSLLSRRRMASATNTLPGRRPCTLVHHLATSSWYLCHQQSTQQLLLGIYARIKWYTGISVCNFTNQSCEMSLISVNDDTLPYVVSTNDVTSHVFIKHHNWEQTASSLKTVLYAKADSADSG